MIYTFTLSPALDLTVKCIGFACGEINRAEETEIFPGGKGINISIILNELGIENEAVGISAGFTGAELERLLGERKIKYSFIRLESGMTRINVKIKGKEETDVNGQGADIPESAFDALLEKINTFKKGDTAIFSGSVPKNVQPFAYERLCERAAEKGASIIVDAEGELLTRTLKYKPFLIKPNKAELEGIFSHHLDCDSEIEEHAKKLLDSGAQNVLVSLGAGGSMLVNKDFTDRLPSFSGKVINTTGAGDSMLAGFVAGYLKENNLKKAHLLASAAGSATAFSASLATADSIKSLLKNK